MKIKKILLSVLAMFMLVACSTNKPMILLNEDAKVSNFYINTTHARLRKIGAVKTKEAYEKGVKDLINVFTGLKLEKSGLNLNLNLKDYDEDILNIFNIFHDYCIYDLKSISYLSKNEVELEYLVKIPNILSLREIFITNEKEFKKILKNADDKMKEFTLKYPANVIEKNPDIFIKFVLKEVIPNIEKEVLDILKSQNKYMELTDFLKLKKEKYEWELVPNDTNYSKDSKYTVLINDKLNLDKGQIEQIKQIAHKMFEEQNNEIAKNFKQFEKMGMTEFFEIMKIFFDDFNQELKGIYFINKDKVFLKSEIKIIDYYPVVTEFLQLVIDNKEIRENQKKAILTLKEILNKQIKNKKYRYASYYTMLENKENGWKIVPIIKSPEIDEMLKEAEKMKREAEKMKKEMEKSESK
ncbi:hypothetical protein [Oceanivirga salmonicida]|uniref:hypothetical protein n=1 Tax=Oceanivirga salmonicida TaxID=1769291 RepID=UPI00082F751A|nr:hypothetical protein [Oceanivirga salmonicida]